MSEYPTTAAGWSVYLQAAHGARNQARRDLVHTEQDVHAAWAAFCAWRNSPEQLFEAWAPICKRLTRELCRDFEVMHNGGGTHAISANFGPVRVLITDYSDGDLSHPDAGTGWWVGFSLPDSSWTGAVESIVGDPDARGADDLIKLVAFAVADYWRGVRHEIDPQPGNYADGIPRQSYSA